MPWSIKREALNVVQELCKFSVGSSSSFVTVGRRIPRECECFLFDAVFSRSAGRGGSVVFFCACFVPFERPVKLRETAIEQESLQAAYSFLK